jgi:hypothetical protein
MAIPQLGNIVKDYGATLAKQQREQERPLKAKRRMTDRKKLKPLGQKRRTVESRFVVVRAILDSHRHRYLPFHTTNAPMLESIADQFNHDPKMALTWPWWIGPRRSLVSGD